MDAVFAVFDEVLNLIKSRLTCIAYVLGALGSESHVIHGKHYGMKERLVWVVERAVNEDVLLVLRWAEGSGHEVQTLPYCGIESLLLDQWGSQLERDSRTASVTALLIASLLAVRGGAIGRSTFRGSLGGNGSDP